MPMNFNMVGWPKCSETDVCGSWWDTRYRSGKDFIVGHIMKAAITAALEVQQ